MSATGETMIDGIDRDLLKEQRNRLNTMLVRAQAREDREDAEALLGIQHLLDAIADVLDGDTTA